MRHSVLTCSIILPIIIKIFLMVMNLCSGNENEERIWIRGHNYYRKISRVVILVRNTPCSIIQSSIVKIFLMVTELYARNKNEVKIEPGDIIRK